MSQWHDEKDKKKDMIRDISHKHTPDSVRESAYRELERRGISRNEAKKLADEKYGDFW